MVCDLEMFYNYLVYDVLVFFFLERTDEKNFHASLFPLECSRGSVY